MYDDDLEKTRALNELNELNKEEKVELPPSTDTAEFNLEDKEALFNNLTREEQIIKEDDNKEEKPKKKESLIDKFKKLPKKNKIIIISICVVVLLLLIGLIIFLVTNKKEGKKDELPSVVLAKDNYKYSDGILTIYNEKEEVLGTYNCDNKDENKCYVAYVNNDEDTFDVIKNVYEDGSTVKVRSQAIANRYIFIYDNESSESTKIKLYDMLNNKVMDEYLGVKQYDVETKNIAVLKNTDNKYGIVKFDESSATNMIDFVYDYIGIKDKEKDNLIIVKNDKGYYLADYTNNLKTKVFNGEIIDYNDNYVIIKTANSKYTVFNYTGEEFNKDYDYITLINDDLLAVVKDNNLYIRGYADNKYNEEGYELTNSDYQKVYTFDNKLKVVSTSYAYAFELHDNTLTIKLQNTDKTSREERLNLKDGSVSATYKYYSYLNGKLYFYEDEEKTKVIGTYECKNKNSYPNDTLTNCRVATSTQFSDSYITPLKEIESVAPIYNSRYAFIYDAPDLANDTNAEIKFYDLKDGKSLGTYLEIDTNATENLKDLTYVSTNNSTIIARLKSNKMGLIEINQDGASVNQNFKFVHERIERAGKDYIVKLESGKYQIVYEGGKYNSAEFDGKIMNYANSYVVVKIDNKVHLYNGDGSAHKVKDAFDYIDITNKNVFGAVSNNKLTIYDYEGNKINTDDITLHTNTYYNAKNVAFKLTSDDKEVTVKVYDKDGSVTSTIKLNLTKEDKEGE